MGVYSEFSGFLLQVMERELETGSFSWSFAGYAYMERISMKVLLANAELCRVVCLYRKSSFENSSTRRKNVIASLSTLD